MFITIVGTIITELRCIVIEVAGKRSSSERFERDLWTRRRETTLGWLRLDYCGCCVCVGGCVPGGGVCPGMANAGPLGLNTDPGALPAAFG
jgi:hypothetical protein